MKELVEAAQNSIAVRTHISDEERFHILSLMDFVHYLESQIHELERLIDAKASHFPAYRMLLSFTGCGKPTAATIIAELGDLSRFHKASQIVSFAGLFGYNSDSGDSVNKRGKLSKKGSREPVSYTHLDVYKRQGAYLANNSLLNEKPPVETITASAIIS